MTSGTVDETAQCACCPNLFGVFNWNANHHVADTGSHDLSVRGLPMAFSYVTVGVCFVSIRWSIMNFIGQNLILKQKNKSVTKF